MSFIDQVDELGIIEQTVARVEKLEESEARKLLKRFKEIRQDLRDRLDIFQAEQFSAQQTRGVLLQVNAAIDAMNNALKQDIQVGAETMAANGADDLAQEIRKFSGEFTGAVIPININSALIGLDTKNFLINRFETSINSYSENLRAILAGQLTNLSIQEIPFDTMLRKLSRFWIGEEWKLRRIARTELHNLYNLGKMNGMKAVKEEQIPTLKKALFHPMSSRTGEDSKLLAKINPIVEIEKPFKFLWKGKQREFMAPPDRPNDRAVLIPFMREWETTKKVA